MTYTSSLFTRASAAGWLVLVPSLPSLDADFPDLADRLLEHIDLGKGVLFLGASVTDEGEALALAEDLAILLGGVCDRANVEEVAAGAWRGVGMVILHGGSSKDWVGTLASASWQTGAQTDMGNDAILMAAGPATAALGSSMWQPGGERLEPGAAWLPGCVVLPGTEDPAGVPAVREALASTQRLYAIGLPDGAVLALGPEGQVESWGQARPTIALGRGWRQL